MSLALKNKKIYFLSRLLQFQKGYITFVVWLSFELCETLNKSLPFARRWPCCLKDDCDIKLFGQALKLNYKASCVKVRHALAEPFVIHLNYSTCKAQIYSIITVASARNIFCLIINSSVLVLVLFFKFSFNLLWCVFSAHLFCSFR